MSGPADRSDHGSGGAAGGALDLHEVFSDPGGSEGGRTRSAVDGTALWAPLPAPVHADPVAGCRRWPETLRLLSSQGELVRGRCKATNLCAYCARLAAVETSEMLALDALHGVAPTLWAVLTTPQASFDTAPFYRSREQLQRALRRRWPDLQLASIVEFTTGYGPRSGGLRRPHWNLLVKGVEADDQARVHDVIGKVWCPRVEAKPQAQYVGEIAQAGGLMRYLTLHFLKESQAPPAGWRGHRFLATDDYLWLPRRQARQAARDSLREKRAVRAAQHAGHAAHDAELVAHEAQATARATTWRLVRHEGG